MERFLKALKDLKDLKALKFLKTLKARKAEIGHLTDSKAINLLHEQLAHLYE